MDGCSVASVTWLGATYLGHPCTRSSSVFKAYDWSALLLRTKCLYFFWGVREQSHPLCVHRIIVCFSMHVNPRCLLRVKFNHGCLRQPVKAFTTSASVTSGHNRWSKIKHDKGKEDAAKTKQRSIISHEIAQASKRRFRDPWQFEFPRILLLNSPTQSTPQTPTSTPASPKPSPRRKRPASRNPPSRPLYPAGRACRRLARRSRTSCWKP